MKDDDVYLSFILECIGENRLIIRAIPGRSADGGCRMNVFLSKNS